MTITKEVSIFIAEDHLMARLGLKILLEQTSNFRVVGEAEDGQTAVDEILKLKPEVIMMDIGLPKVDGVAATAAIKKALPASKVLIFTSLEDEESIFKALGAGADGYCLKTITGDMLANAINAVLTGAAWLDPGIANTVLRAQTKARPESGNALTNSKIQLLSLVEQGRSVDEIASELKVNDSLVKGLLNELLSQLKGDLHAPTAVSTAVPQEAAAREPANSAGAGIRPGEIIASHYKIEERIGHGGMGSVFKASHTFIDRKVAVKTLHEHLASDRELLGRFKSEAEASAGVVHQNLVTIYDFGLLNDKTPYIVMEYLDGIDLDDFIGQRGTIDPAIAKSVFAQVCDALAAVHARGIVHRDMKPSNIMLVKVGDDPYFPKLVDFGIAKILDGARESFTMTGEAIGSPPYMSPEQCSARSVDHRSDIYSLGCVMFEAYSGRSVFERSTALEMMMKHVQEEPSPIPLMDAKAPKHVVRLIMRMLEKNPESRPATASEVKELLLKG